MELVRQNTGLALIGRLKEISDKEFKDFLMKEYHKLLLKNGQNAPDPVNAGLIVNELYRHLQAEWPGIKTDWIAKAFDNGINEEYGEFANISYRLMMHWIREFKHSMKSADFGVKEDPMNTKERAIFVLDELRKRNPELTKLDNRGKEALKRKVNKTE